ncbi:hypothetical protein U0070_009016, partial [Myodes glareolus]
MIMLFSATLNEGVLKIRNADISQVIFVGIIRHAEKAPTKIIYKTDDVTAAAMDVCQWVDTEDASGENTVVTPETYLNRLIAFTIFPLEDINEFIAHILEVINSHMMLSKSNNQPSAKWLSQKTPGELLCARKWPHCGPKPGAEFDQGLPKTGRRLEGLNFQNVRNQFHTCSLNQASSGFSGQEGAPYSSFYGSRLGVGTMFTSQSAFENPNNCWLRIPKSASVSKE